MPQKQTSPCELDGTYLVQISYLKNNNYFKKSYLEIQKKLYIYKLVLQFHKNMPRSLKLILILIMNHVIKLTSEYKTKLI